MFNPTGPRTVIGVCRSVPALPCVALKLAFGDGDEDIGLLFAGHAAVALVGATP